MNLDELLRMKEHMNDPYVVVHCGSTTYAREAFEQWCLFDTLSGHIVLTIGARKADTDLALTDGQCIVLDILHLFKIQIADVVRVLNVGGYIGESTRREVEYAVRLQKHIVFLEPVPRGWVPAHLVLDSF